MHKQHAAFIACILMLLNLTACSGNQHQQHRQNPVNSVQTQSTIADLEIQPETSVFETQNIVRITFHGHYGNDAGTEVPAEHMSEITSWLASFTVGAKAPDLLPPGTNTYYVKLEYADGTVIQTGLDVITVGGVGYIVNRNPQPECFAEIVSEASMD